MSSANPGFPLIDAERFLESMGGDAALCSEILKTGLTEGDEQMVRIRNLTGDSDKDSAIRTLHSLRGGSGNFQATSLVALLQRMESECEVGGVNSLLPHLETFEIESIAYRKGLLCLIEEFRTRL